MGPAAKQHVRLYLCVSVCPDQGARKDMVKEPCPGGEGKNFLNKNQPSRCRVRGATAAAASWGVGESENLKHGTGGSRGG